MKGNYKAVIFILVALCTTVYSQTDSLNIFWDQNPEPDMYAYKLYRSVNGSPNFQVLMTVYHPTTHTTDNQAIVPGTLYAYTLTAVDSAGNQSGFSDTVSVGLPEIDWPLSGIPTGQSTTIALTDFLDDPDGAISTLSLSCSNEVNIQAAVSGNELLLTPEPINFTGIAHFNLKVRDPDSLWDRETIHLNVGNVAGQDEKLGQPIKFRVRQNFPNPFNPSTEIRFSLPRDEFVRVVIYNALGQKVRILLSGNQTIGTHRVVWDGRNEAGKKVGSGHYIYAVITEHSRVFKRMILQK